MPSDLRATLWLLLFTLVICAVLYPLLLLGIGQAAFPEEAAGSLITDAQGSVVGSRLIAQPFTGDEYFWPRPSAASYNAASSGASNWGASNPLFRDRVARQLGPIVKYASGPKKGQLVGPDIEAWFRSKPELVARWAETIKRKTPEGDEKRLDPAKEGTDLQATFFDMWRQEHPDVVLEDVPADMVTASGSGLDPHITLENARYQLDRVAQAWAKKTKNDTGKVRAEIEKVLDEKQQAPLGGLVGVPLVNVLEVNLALARRLDNLMISR